MNVWQIMEGVILMQFAQILQEVLIALVNLDFLGMDLVVLVIFFFFFFFFQARDIFVFNLTKSIVKSIDINECSTNNGGCDAQAVCTNTPGSFSCSCKSGYSGNGFNCLGNSFLNSHIIYYLYLSIYFFI